MMQQNSREFFPAPFGASFKFAQKAFMIRTSTIFCDFNFDILLTVLVNLQKKINLVGVLKFGVLGVCVPDIFVSY